MSGGNKKQRNAFLNYLEDYDDIEEVIDEEVSEKKQWINENLDKSSHKKRFLGLVYVLSGVIFWGVVIFWWNISRAQFYRALDKPVADDQIQEFLLFLDENQLNGTNLDLENQLDQIDEKTLSVDEQRALSELKKKINDGASLDDLINEIK
jgi:cytoskeletal protein RodZ